MEPIERLGIPSHNPLHPPSSSHTLHDRFFVADVNQKCSDNQVATFISITKRPSETDGA